MKKSVSILLFVLLAAGLGYLFWETCPAICMAREGSVLTARPDDSVRVVERIIVKDPPRAPKVPPFVVFAGDTIRFDRADLYERMDRELTAFTYGHTNSLLMLKRAGRIFPQIEPILSSGVLVAHNASFDMGVLRKCLESYGIEIVENIPIEIEPNPYNERYMRTKKEKMHHNLHLV